MTSFFEALGVALTLMSIVALFLVEVGLASRFIEQASLVDGDRFTNRLAHVVDSEGCCRGSREGFHFNARSSSC